MLREDDPRPRKSREADERPARETAPGAEIPCPQGQSAELLLLVMLLASLLLWYWKCWLREEVSGIEKWRDAMG